MISRNQVPVLQVSVSVSLGIYSLLPPENTKFGERQYFHKRVSRILFTGGVASFGGRLVPRGGLCSGGRGSVPGGPSGDPPMTATAAGGTHPTGMHSC